VLQPLAGQSVPPRQLLQPPASSLFAACATACSPDALRAVFSNITALKFGAGRLSTIQSLEYRKLNTGIVKHIRRKRVLPWDTDVKQIPNQPLEQFSTA